MNGTRLFGDFLCGRFNIVMELQFIMTELPLVE